jgi:hypothetical protein
MEYNSEREHLIIPEYGRNVQKMIEHACTIADREERNKAAKTIVVAMSVLNPALKNTENFQQILWDQLIIISDFKLDIDSPYPIPEKNKLVEKPEKINYPSKNIKFKHYGKTVEELIAKAVEIENPDEKKELTKLIANLMKRNYLNWNRDSVNDELIINQLTQLSDGKLNLESDFNFVSTGEILSNKPKKKIMGKNNQKNRNRLRRKF